MYICIMYIYVNQGGLTTSPQRESSIPQQLNTNVVWERLAKRSQVLRNMHNFLQTWITCVKRAEPL